MLSKLIINVNWSNHLKYCISLSDTGKRRKNWITVSILLPQLRKALMESSKLHLKLHSSNRLKLSWIILLYLGLETCEDENQNGESRIHVNMFILRELRLAALQRFVPCNDSWWRKKMKRRHWCYERSYYLHFRCYKTHF